MAMMLWTVRSAQWASLRESRQGTYAMLAARKSEKGEELRRR